MQFSIGVEYALHSLINLIDAPVDSPIGIKELATYQGVSESYLSKFFTQLTKSGIVRSIPGVKGGYELAKNPEDISFGDVVSAIQGNSPLFRCKEIRNNIIPCRGKSSPSREKCLINSVMLEAELQLMNFLRTKSLAWLNEHLDENVPELQEHRKRWFKEALLKR